ncbi:MAG: hypothetical protein MJA83_14535, partial [Gammaproteobacteria bacterium]|nr:hypothetical protein [Gammaproteobacteria bacterium]
MSGNNNDKDFSIAIAAGLVIASIILAMTGHFASSVSLKDGFTAADLSLFFADIFLAALLVERATEFLYGARRERGKVAFKEAITKFKTKSEKKPLTNAEEDTYEKARKDLAEYRDRTRRVSLVISIVFGLVFAAAGFHVLGVIFETGDLSDLQDKLFLSLDILF